jgi:hypothetical protein
MDASFQNYMHKKYHAPAHGRCYFETPGEFSKKNAAEPRTDLNYGSGLQFAAYYWYYPAEGCYVACQWMLIMQSKPWRVDATWLSEIVPVQTGAHMQPPHPGLDLTYV